MRHFKFNLKDKTLSFMRNFYIAIVEVINETLITLFNFDSHRLPKDYKQTIKDKLMEYKHLKNGSKKSLDFLVPKLKKKEQYQVKLT